MDSSGQDTKGTSRAVPAAASFFAQRWGTELMTRGFIGLPITLVRMQARLALEPIDLCVIAHLLTYWADELPYPAQKTLAKAIGVHVRTLRRRLREMKLRGYLEMHKTVSKKTGRVVQTYDLKPLIRQATAIAIRRGEDEARGGSITFTKVVRG